MEILYGRKKCFVFAFLKDVFDIHDDSAPQEVIRDRLVSGGKITGTNMCVLVLAVFIASIGLNMNSTAVIIGAMLISPLMGSILTAAYATASADIQMFEKAAMGFIFQIGFCLAASTLYFLISPISSETSELLARTTPTVWDVLIAIFGGLAGIIGITRKEKSNVIPGVAIATALMPPLCTCGYGIARGNWVFVGGAFYLFVVNSYFIFLSAAAVLILLKVPRVHNGTPAVWKKFKRKIIRNTIILIIPSIFFAGAMVSAQQHENTSATGFSQSHTNLIYVTEQMKILFPSVNNAEVIQTEEGDTLKIHIIVNVNTLMSDEELQRLDAWLDSVYESDCTVEQKI